MGDYTGKYVPRPFFKRISLEESDSGQETIATVDIVLKTNQLSDLHDIKGNLKLGLIRISNPLVFRSISSPRARMTLLNEIKKSTNIKGASLTEAETRTIDISSPGTTGTEYYNQTTNNTNIMHTEKFHIDGHDPNFLAFIAVVCYQSDDNAPMNPTLSEVTTEIAIRGGNAIKSARLLTAPNPKSPAEYSVPHVGANVWAGPVQISSVDLNTTKFAGTAADGTTVPLEETSVPNTTVQDFREIASIKNLQISNAISQRPIFNPPGGKTHGGNMKQPTNAYFSNIHLAVDPMEGCRFQFSINLAEIIKDYSQFSRLISSETENGDISLDYENFNFEKVLNLSKIKLLTIKRRRMHHLDKNNQTSLMAALQPNSRMEASTDEETIIVQTSAPGNLLIPKEHSRIESSQYGEQVTKRVGSITELDNIFFQPMTDKNGRNIPLFQFRHLSGTDYDVENIDGLYRYSVEIEIEDGTVALLKEMIKNLQTSLDDLEEYHIHVISEAKNTKSNFNIKSNNFINAHELNATAALDTKKPWMSAATYLADVAKTFNIKIPPNLIGAGHASEGPGIGMISENIEENLYLISSPSTGSIKGISLLITAIQQTLNKLNSILELSSGGAQRKGNDSKMESSGLGNRSPSTAFTIEHKFEETFDASWFKEAGFDYLDSGTQTEKGLMNIDIREFEKRTRNETKKYFTPQAIEAGKIIPDTKFEDFLETTEISFLTPQTIHLPEIKYDMLSSNPDKHALKTLIDIVSYKKSGHASEGDYEQEESVGGLTTQENKMEARIRSTLLDLLSPQSCTVEEKQPTPTKDDAADEVLKEDILGISLTTKSDSQAAPKPDNSLTTFKNEIPLSLNINNILAPLIFIGDLNILEESIRLRNFNINSKSFTQIEPGPRKILPNHLKSLIADSAGDATVVHNWYAANNSIEKMAFFIIHYKTLATIEVMTGFRGGNLRDPIWKRITSGLVQTATSSDKRSLLCRFRPYLNTKKGFIPNAMANLPAHNEHFLINVLNTSAPTSTVAQIAAMTPNILDSLENNALLNIDNELINTHIIVAAPVATAAGMPAVTPAAAMGTTTTTTGGGY